LLRKLSGKDGLKEVFGTCGKLTKKVNKRRHYKEKRAPQLSDAGEVFRGGGSRDWVFSSAKKEGGNGEEKGEKNWEKSKLC